jgi:pilus assembly protein Flp/PilA
LLCSIARYSELTGTELDGQKQKSPEAGKGTVGHQPGLFFTHYHMENHMTKITSAVQAFVADENGVTAIEYGLIAALIGVAAATVAGDVGTQLKTLFTTIKGKLVVS